MERHQTRSARRQNRGITSHLIRLREKRRIGTEVLEKITKALDIPTEAITELNEGALINIYSGTWQDNATAAGSIQNQTFNPIDKIVELYERLLKAEQEKVAMLHEIIKDK